VKGPAVKREADWGHLAFLAVIAGIVLWYLQDAIFVSLAANNLLLVLPLGLVVLGFCAAVVPQCLRKEDPNRKVKSHVMKELSADDLRTGDRRKLAVIVGMAASLGLYVLLLNIIGFDVATVLFAAVAMFICGERRPLPLIIYSLLVGGILVWAFRALLPFPMYTLIL
jgi:type IV secretory pathway TrbD component